MTDKIDLNNFKNLKSDNIIYIDYNIVFIPLTFYYSGNIMIGDERLTYRSSLDKKQLRDGNYSVRFFVLVEKSDTINQLKIC